MAIDYYYIFEILRRFENGGKAGLRRAYIPKSNGLILGNSGVTIGTGVDLGQQTLASLRAMAVPAQLIGILKPYLGLKKEAAAQKLASLPLILSQDAVESLDKAVSIAYIQKLEKKFNSSPNNSSLDNSNAGNSSLGNSSLGNSNAGNSNADISSLGNSNADISSLGNSNADISSLGNSSLGNSNADISSLGNSSLGNSNADISSLGNSSLGNSSPNSSGLGNSPFSARPKEVQAVAVSLAYHLGLNGFPSTLSSLIKADYAAAIKELEAPASWNNKYMARRYGEAALLRQITR